MDTMSLSVVYIVIRMGKEKEENDFLKFKNNFMF